MSWQTALVLQFSPRCSLSVPRAACRVDGTRPPPGLSNRDPLTASPRELLSHAPVPHSELKPLGAYTVLGRPLADLAGECVALEDAFGPGGRELADRLREERDWDARFDVLERFLVGRVAVGPAPTPAVAWADRRLRGAGGNGRIAALAAELGCSRRYLTSRFSAEVGLGPKAVARQVRFADVRERLARAPQRLAEIAPAAGYCDQAHLNRDFRELAGVTPTEFVARLIPGGGVVGDGL